MKNRIRLFVIEEEKKQWKLNLDRNIERPVFPPTRHLTCHFVNCSQKTFFTCGLYYKNIMIENDTSRVIRMMAVSDAPSCGIILVTLEVSLAHILFFIIYAPRVINYAPRNIYSTGVTHDDHHLQSSDFHSTGH